MKLLKLVNQIVRISITIKKLQLRAIEAPYQLMESMDTWKNGRRNYLQVKTLLTPKP